MPFIARLSWLKLTANTVLLCGCCAKVPADPSLFRCVTFQIPDCSEQHIATTTTTELMIIKLGTNFTNLKCDTSSQLAFYELDTVLRFSTLGFLRAADPNRSGAFASKLFRSARFRGKPAVASWMASRVRFTAAFVSPRIAGNKLHRHKSAIIKLWRPIRRQWLRLWWIS